jgi:iron complex transport system substrate-binding protein
MQKQILLVFLILGFIASIFWALHPSQPARPAPLLAQKPQRIVSQTLATDEVLLAICPPERIAALSPLATDSSYSNVTEIAEKLGRSVHNLEQLLTLQPDLVLVAHYNRAELLTLLQQVQIPTLKLSRFSQLQDIQENIRSIGQAIGEETRATELLEQMNTALTKLQTQIPKGVPPRVISYSLEGLTAGQDTTFDAIVRAIGAVNLSAEQGIQGVVALSSEQLIAWQPDFIVVGAPANQFEVILQQLQTQPTFRAIHGKIIFIEQRYLLTASHHVITAIEQLARQIYNIE